MKKIILCILVCIFVCVYSCKIFLNKIVSQDGKSIFVDNIVANNNDLIDSKYYKIVSGDNFVDYYYIYDINGNLLDDGSTDRPLKIQLISEDVIELRIGMGSGISLTKFYDIKKGIISKEFHDVLLSSASLCVHIDDYDVTKLVAENIFDKEKYYKTFKLNLSKVPTSVNSIKFVNNDTQLEISYQEGLNFTNKTTILNL